MPRFYSFSHTTVMLLTTTRFQDDAVVMSSANGWVGRYWVRISVPAPTQSGILKAQWVGVM